MGRNISRDLRSIAPELAGSVGDSLRQQREDTRADRLLVEERRGRLAEIAATGEQKRLTQTQLGTQRTALETQQQEGRVELSEINVNLDKALNKAKITSSEDIAKANRALQLGISNVNAELARNDQALRRELSLNNIDYQRGNAADERAFKAVQNALLQDFERAERAFDRELKKSLSTEQVRQFNAQIGFERANATLDQLNTLTRTVASAQIGTDIGSLVSLVTGEIGKFQTPRVLPTAVQPLDQAGIAPVGSGQLLPPSPQAPGVSPAPLVPQRAPGRSGRLQRGDTPNQFVGLGAAIENSFGLNTERFSGRRTPTRRTPTVNPFINGLQQLQRPINQQQQPFDPSQLNINR